MRKRGRPPKGSNETKIREARARAALLVSSHLQGMDTFARNVRDSVEVAIEKDPEIISQILEHVLRTYGRKEVVPGGRTNSGTRVLPDSTHLGMRNSVLAHAERHNTNAGIEAIRKLGGRSVIDNPKNDAEVGGSATRDTPDQIRRKNSKHRCVHTPRIAHK